MSWRVRTVLLLMFVMLCRSATAQHTVAEQYLFQAINAERAAAGLPSVTWNPTLTHAAQEHAFRMRSSQAISHQFQGEPGLAERAAASGSRFSRVAENVATSTSILEMHTALMNSPRHRDNILDPQVNSIGISVVVSGRQMWGVEDFARDVQPLSYRQQETQVAQLVSAAGASSVEASDAARATCRQSSGYAGDRPAFVMRFTSTDLNHLPAQLTTRIAQGGFSSAAIGACDMKTKSSFATYNIAVVLYP
ncbi:CAP domain-containing protein [Terriglobus sp. TAA 43]|uniref:CAP domain-containing protein n=1 Tax=Terriglobus sp. TAA 43 TaxID=278961 RepID=UPI0012ED5751|nr:CAP domain-containing protein [Terriglobus sp. TAA 43]